MTNLLVSRSLIVSLEKADRGLRYIHWRVFNEPIVEVSRSSSLEKERLNTVAFWLEVGPGPIRATKLQTVVVYDRL